MPKRNLAKEKISLAIVIIVILSVAAAVAVWWLQTSEPVDEVLVVSKAGASFSKTGNVVINNPGLEKNVWYLIYEEPGKPALSAKLSFPEGSKCQSAKMNKECRQFSLYLYAGSRAKVEGKVRGSEVVVDKLTIVE